VDSPQKILVIKSHNSELKNVEKFLLEIFDDCKFSKNNFNKVFLCVMEAVMNSIEHGNKNDREKTVSIKISCEENVMNVTIYDEGEGFDLNGIQDPTKEENIKKESGRGIHIIKALTEKMEYNNEENYFQFKIECT